MSQNDTTESAPDPNAPDPAGADLSLDLPADMFRAGEHAEETTLLMQRRNIGPMSVDVKFTEVDSMALFEGDIVLGPADVVRGADDPHALGIGIVGAEFRWPDGIVPYVTESALQLIVAAAIVHWQQHTPFQFVQRTNEPDYISFERRKGCWSRVGRQRGVQVISLGLGCGLGAAIHEIGHALGLWHEQSRSDRDDHIEIMWDNIDPEHQHNFDKHIQDGEDLGAYDYGSIMHYPATAFSINKEQPTIRVKGGQSIGQRHGLSKGDITAIKLMYPDLNWPPG